MKLTLIHPCIGRRAGQRYIRTWQMEPLQPALIAGLTPAGIEVRFHDDRMEAIPYDEPTDLVAISVETYTARRAYQIASEYRRRGVPVVMGGFHATLCPEEVLQFAEAIVDGEAEGVWEMLIDDFRSGTLERVYQADSRPDLSGQRYDRSIFRGKRYLPIGLVEAGRGCRFRCEFCAVQSFFQASHVLRPVEEIVSELTMLKKEKKFFFFVDDNFAADMTHTRELMRALAPLNIRWVTQMSINAAHDEEFLRLLAGSGCRGVLIGFESLNADTLHQMNKDFNVARGGFAAALGNLRRHGLRVYATFVFGYDADGPESFADAVAFARDERFYIAAFNHLTPFPGTPLYERLEREERLLYGKWWMDEDYRYNQIPFRPQRMSPRELQAHCLDARRAFYAPGSILRRGLDRTNRSDGFMFRNFFLINAMHRAEIRERNHYPLGDEAWQGPYLKAG